MLVLSIIERIKGDVITGNIIWNADDDVFYGAVNEFNTSFEFEQKVRNEYATSHDILPDDVVISTVQIIPCISTEKGIVSETLQPLANTDIEIANYYYASGICTKEELN